MSVEQIEATIRALPSAEREKLVAWLDDHRHELIDETHVNPEVRAEINLRLRETNEHPDLMEPFAESDLDQMFKEFAHGRTKKASARKS